MNWQAEQMNCFCYKAAIREYQVNFQNQFFSPFLNFNIISLTEGPTRR